MRDKMLQSVLNKEYSSIERIFLNLKAIGIKMLQSLQSKVKIWHFYLIKAISYVIIRIWQSVRNKEYSSIKRIFPNSKTIGIKMLQSLQSIVKIWHFYLLKAIYYVIIRIWQSQIIVKIWHFYLIKAIYYVIIRI